MTGGWSGIRSGSYGSLDKQLQIYGNGVLPVQTTTRSKPPKMLKEKERLFHWICKFAGRRKVGMLLLCIVSAAVFVWVLYVGKGEDSQDGDRINIVLNNGSSFITYLSVSQTNREQTNSVDSKTSIIRKAFENFALSPPPPQYFIGYTLPQGHLCNNFTVPPPPADKKRTGPRPCPVCYLPVDEAIALMPEASSFSPVLKNLTYIYEEKLNRETEFGGSEFGGYPSLSQRSDSYDIRESMSVHCGFVKGIKPGHQTGFDMDDSDLLEMEQCRGVVVASAIFGAFDLIQQPSNISEYSKKTVCFFMFVDEETEAYLKNNSGLDNKKRVDLWRLVVVHNLPYTDGRRNGKIPKLLVHRMFPNARYSLWIDGKLELVVDPYQILERFLWRKNATFAISKHYKRFDVFIEAEANKAAAKYDNASIDFQIEFYKKEGLTPYSESKLPITSDVPEGCIIIREHVPISNLFTCLWFNEVDRFTSRDQISFSTVRDKIRAKTNWTVNMFLDCERRNVVVQKYHRDVLERLRAPAIHPSPLPPVLVNALPVKLSADTSPERAGPPPPPARKLPRRVRDRKSGSRRHRKIVAGATDSG
ncbi:F3H9.11 protein isoform 1 [Tripterygium wilfordii]|uniref:F3H9.11 protein isoform 1 n=1 Tax=Tripterygium wilfordii TaxID=458696 RepID=A0A7J7C3H8_TRIWF|nr:uncharacterized protein LOC119989463 [Tripterygium wilfordii]KAF5728682.1 F3H9.11 protein isoform 1 [Tripterygium wilfordii]